MIIKGFQFSVEINQAISLVLVFVLLRFEMEQFLIECHKLNQNQDNHSRQSQSPLT